MPQSKNSLVVRGRSNALRIIWLMRPDGPLDLPRIFLVLLGQTKNWRKSMKGVIMRRNTSVVTAPELESGISRLKAWRVNQFHYVAIFFREELFFLLEKYLYMSMVFEINIKIFFNLISDKWKSIMPFIFYSISIYTLYNTY